MRGWGASRILKLAVSLVFYLFALVQVLLVCSMPPLLLLLCSIFTDVMTSVCKKGKGGSGLACGTSVACSPFAHTIETFLIYACCAFLVTCETQKQQILAKAKQSNRIGIDVIVSPERFKQNGWNGQSVERSDLFI